VLVNSFNNITWTVEMPQLTSLHRAVEFLTSSESPFCRRDSLRLRYDLCCVGLAIKLYFTPCIRDLLVLIDLPISQLFQLSTLLWQNIPFWVAALN